MIIRMAKARTEIQFFFPKEPLPQSPCATSGLTWKSKGRQPHTSCVRDKLEKILQGSPEVVPGYSISEASGTWFNDEMQQWEKDPVVVITSYVGPEFVGELKDPNNPTSPAKCFVAAIAMLSCLEMGHAVFFGIVDGGQEVSFTKQGFEITKDEFLPYDLILARIIHDVAEAYE